MKFKAILYGLVEAASSIIDNLGLVDEVKTRVNTRIRASSPSQPFVLKRLQRMVIPPPATQTEYGYLIGIPEMSEPVEVSYVIEEHVTPRNQRREYTRDELLKMKPGQKNVRVHWDLRFRDPYTKKIHAFAIPKAELPEGKVATALKVDDRHGHRYLINKGEPIGNDKVLISDGYGRGVSKVLQTGKTFAWTSKDGHLHIHIPKHGVVVLIKQENNQYLLISKKPKEQLHTGRPFDLVDISGNKEMFKKLVADDNYIAEKKLDGAFYTIRVAKDGYVTIISRRPKHVDGQPTDIGIDRSMNLLHVKFAQWPEWTWGKEFYVEIHSETRKGYPHEFNRAAAILNSDPARAFELQKSDPLKISILGMSGFDDYTDKRATAIRLTKEVKYRGIYPISIPTGAETPSGKMMLTHKLEAEDSEGVVFKHKKNGVMYKWVFKGPTIDMKIVGVELMRTSQEKYMKDGQVIAAQRFEVVEPGGRRSYVVIRDPSGIPGSTDQLRLDVGQNPNKYIGKYVEVRPRRSNRQSAGDIMRIREDK